MDAKPIIDALKSLTAAISCLTSVYRVLYSTSIEGCASFFLPQNAPAHSEVPPGCCGGRRLARGVQEAEKTHVAPFATHLSYALEHGTAEDSLTSP